MGVKQKSSGNPFLGALVVAAIVGSFAESWTVFTVVATVLVCYPIASKIYGVRRPNKGKAAVGTGNRRHERQ